MSMTFSLFVHRKWSQLLGAALPVAWVLTSNYLDGPPAIAFRTLAKNASKSTLGSRRPGFSKLFSLEYIQALVNLRQESSVGHSSSVLSVPAYSQHCTSAPRWLTCRLHLTPFPHRWVSTAWCCSTSEARQSLISFALKRCNAGLTYEHRSL